MREDGLHGLGDGGLFEGLFGVAEGERVGHRLVAFLYLLAFVDVEQFYGCE